MPSLPRRRRRHPDDREILRLALPALGALMAEPLYVLTDTAVVGHLGTPQLGGLAVAGTLLTTGFTLFNFLAYGTTASVARSAGAGDAGAGARHAVQALWLGLGLGVALALAGLAVAGPAVSLMGASDAVRPHALTYLRISLAGAPAVLVTLVGVGYLRGVQNTRAPLMVALGGNVLNLILEVTLIYGLGFGLAASAWATVVAQALAALVMVWLLAGHARAAQARWRINWRALRALATVGRDLFLRTGSLLVALAVASAVAARVGTADLGAHQVAFQLWTFLALVLDALAIAAQAMVGHRLGAGDAASARAASRRMLEWGLLAGLAFALLVVLLRPVLPPIFSDDPDVQRHARDVLWFVAALQPVNAIVFVLDGVLIGAGDMRFLALAMVGALAVYLPASLLVGALGWSLLWVWAAISLLMLARLAAVAWRFNGDAWAVTGAAPTDL